MHIRTMVQQEPHNLNVYSLKSSVCGLVLWGSFQVERYWGLNEADRGGSCRNGIGGSRFCVAEVGRNMVGRNMATVDVRKGKLRMTNSLCYAYYANRWHSPMLWFSLKNRLWWEKNTVRKNRKGIGGLGIGVKWQGSCMRMRAYLSMVPLFPHSNVSISKFGKELRRLPIS